jgi:hypothetical protein
MEILLKKSLSRFALLLTSLSLSAAAVCHASDNTPLMPGDEQTVLPLVPREIDLMLLEPLEAKDAGSAALVCKAWHQAYQTHMTSRLRRERDLMLHDEHTWSSALSTPALTPVLANIFEEDGFVFVPFGHEHFPETGVPLSDEDIAPLAVYLYAKAFDDLKDPLTPQDLLCLKAALPWKRMFVQQDNPTAKRSALACLEALSPNPDLALYDSEKAFTLVTQKKGTLFIPTNDLKTQRNYLHAMSLHLKQTPALRVHLVLEESLHAPEDPVCLESPIFSSMRHLTVSAPSGFSKAFSLSFLHPCTSLISLVFKDLSSVKTSGSTLENSCPSLRFFDPRGLKSAIDFSTPYTANTPHEMELAYTIHQLQKTIEKNKKNDATSHKDLSSSFLFRFGSVGHYDRLLPETTAGHERHARFTPPAIYTPHTNAPISRESFNNHMTYARQQLTPLLFSDKPAPTEKSISKGNASQSATPTSLENEDGSQACDWGFLWKDQSADLWQQPSNAFWNQTWETFCQTSKVF